MKRISRHGNLPGGPCVSLPDQSTCGIAGRCNKYLNLFGKMERANGFDPSTVVLAMPRVLAKSGLTRHNYDVNIASVE